MVGRPELIGGRFDPQSRGGAFKCPGQGLEPAKLLVDALLGSPITTDDDLSDFRYRRRSCSRRLILACRTSQLLSNPLQPGTECEVVSGRPVVTSQIVEQNTP
jgi:hypothetical protein